MVIVGDGENSADQVENRGGRSMIVRVRCVAPSVNSLHSQQKLTSQSMVPSIRYNIVSSSVAHQTAQQ